MVRRSVDFPVKSDDSVLKCLVGNQMLYGYFSPFIHYFHRFLQPQFYNCLVTFESHVTSAELPCDLSIRGLNVGSRACKPLVNRRCLINHTKKASSNILRLDFVDT